MDLAKRPMDLRYPLHRTVSGRWPATVMVEPPKASRSRRFERSCAAMVAIPSPSGRHESGDFTDPATKNPPPAPRPPHPRCDHAHQWIGPTPPARALTRPACPRTQQVLARPWPGSITPTAIATWSATCPDGGEDWRSAVDIIQSLYQPVKVGGISPPTADWKGGYIPGKTGQPRARLFSNARAAPTPGILNNNDGQQQRPPRPRSPETWQPWPFQ